MILYKGYRYAVETIHGRVHIAPRRSGLVWNSPRCLNFRHLLIFGYQVAEIVHLAAQVPTKLHSFLQRTSAELVQTPDALTFCDPPPPIPSGQYLPNCQSPAVTVLISRRCHFSDASSTHRSGKPGRCAQNQSSRIRGIGRTRSPFLLVGVLNRSDTSHIALLHRVPPYPLPFVRW